MGSWAVALLLIGCLLPATAHLKTVSEGKKNPDDDPCGKVEVVSRREWRARADWHPWTMKTPVNDVIISHTVTSECHTKHQCLRDVFFIQEYHVDYLGWNDIAYNFLVGGDGRIYEGLGWTQAGAHSINFNTNSVGLAFIGDFRNVTPNGSMLDAALELIDCGVHKGYLTPTREIHGHRDVTCSESPGEKLYQIIRTWENYKGGRMPLYDCSTGKV